MNWVNGVTKLDKATMEEFQNEMYPIGKVEVFFDNEDHSNYMGFTWEKVGVGEMLVGVGTRADVNGTTKTFIAGDNSGEYSHAQTASEMCPHRHFTVKTQNGSSSPASSAGIAEYSTSSDLPYSLRAADGEPNHGMTSLAGNSSGTVSKMNITNPTFGVNFWQRTA